jgi:hypothetical protein
MFSVLPVPTATVPSYPGQNLEGSSRRLTERKEAATAPLTPLLGMRAWLSPYFTFQLC